MLEYFVSNFFHNSKTWIGNLVRADGETIYNKWKKYNQSFTYNFRSDCVLLRNVINDNSIRFDDVFRVHNGQHPRLLRLLLSEKISVQTNLLVPDTPAEMDPLCKVYPKQLQAARLLQSATLLYKPGTSLPM